MFTANADESAKGSSYNPTLVLSWQTNRHYLIETQCDWFCIFLLAIVQMQFHQKEVRLKTN